MSMYKIHANLGKNQLEYNVHLIIFALNFAVFISILTLKVRVRSPIFTLACSHVHILNSCKFR